MTSLNTQLSSSAFLNNLENVKDTLANAEVKISFWGSRLITAQGYSGSVRIDDIANRVLKYGENRCKADDLSLAERITGIAIVEKLDALYSNNDDQIKISNFITRFFVWIREFSIIPFTDRFYFDTFAKKNFLAFSKEKFMIAFPNQIDVDSRDMRIEHPDCIGSFGNPFGVRFVARKSSIEAKLQAQN